MKRGRERAEPSNAKRTKEYFRCMVSIDRSTHFYKASRVPHQLRVPGRCQLLLHTIDEMYLVVVGRHM